MSRLSSFAALAALAVLAPQAAADPAPTETVVHPLHYDVFAGGPRLNRKVLGAVTRWVQGVPAEPVDSFVYDGDGSVPIKGTLRMSIDPVAETGWIEARWTDENGEWAYSQQQFVHPEHFSGVRIGSSSLLPPIDLLNEAITQNVYLHGDTTAGMPVAPTVFSHLGIWGPATVTRDGRRFENPFEIPAPRWNGHVMVTEGVRRPDGTIRTIYDDIFDPSLKSEGAVDPNDLEVHLVFHDERFPLTGNTPALYEFFYHLVFENVTIQISQGDTSPGIGRQSPRRERPARTP